MFSPAVAASLFLSLISAASLPAQNLSQPAPSSGVAGAIEGKVLNPDGHPAAGIHVAVEDPNTAVPITSTSTHPDGTFALYNIPRGRYEIVADSGESQVSDVLSIQTGCPKLQLRLPQSTAQSFTSPATMSVARMLVPDSARKEYDKGKAAYLKGKYQDALAHLEQAMIIHPQFADALALRGIIDAQERNLSEAELYLQKSIEADPNYSAAYMMLGAVYNHQGRFDDALRVSEKAVTLSPRAWQGYFEAAKASVGQGMYERALQFARQAERLGGSGFEGLHLVKAYALVPMKLVPRRALRVTGLPLSRHPKDPDAPQAKNLLAQLNTDLAAANSGSH